MAMAMLIIFKVRRQTMEVLEAVLGVEVMREAEVEMEMKEVAADPEL